MGVGTFQKWGAFHEPLHQRTHISQEDVCLTNWSLLPIRLQWLTSSVCQDQSLILNDLPLQYQVVQEVIAEDKAILVLEG